MMEINYDYLLPSPEEMFDDTCEATLLKRLIRILADRNIINGRDLVRLAYPSEQDIEEALHGEIL